MTPQASDETVDEPVVREILSILRTDVVQGAVVFLERVRARLVEVDGATRGPSLWSIAVGVVVELTNLVTSPLNGDERKHNGGCNDDDRTNDD